MSMNARTDASELQNEINTLSTSCYSQVHRMLALNLTDAIIRRSLMLRRAVAATQKNADCLSEQELARLLGI
jgi:hypothetical protein